MLNLRESGSEPPPSYYRARYYDPAAGRFINEDPIGFRGFDLNLFRYVRNQPGRYTDPSGFLTIDPAFNSGCLAALKRALDIVRKLPKKCDCAFRKIGSHRSLKQLVADPSITVHFDPAPETTDEGGHTLDGDTHNIWITPLACRLGRWTLAATLVHELTHITFVPGAGQDDPNGPASTSAYGMERECGLSPLSVPSPPTNVLAAPSGPIPTENSPLPDKLTPP